MFIFQLLQCFLNIFHCKFLCGFNSYAVKDLICVMMSLMVMIVTAAAVAVVVVMMMFIVMVVMVMFMFIVMVVMMIMLFFMVVMMVMAMVVMLMFIRVVMVMMLLFQMVKRFFESIFSFYCIEYLCTCKLIPVGGYYYCIRIVFSKQFNNGFQLLL